MIIYQKNNGQTRTTCVMHSFMESTVSHGSSVWPKHQEAVDNIPDGQVYITGDTSEAGDYDGYYAPDKLYERYTNK